jgi:hypothetical protein
MRNFTITSSISGGSSGSDSENAVVCRIQFDATKKYELLHTHKLYFANYILLATNHGRERDLETKVVLKQNDAAGGAVLRAIDTKIIERQCLRA